MKLSDYVGAGGGGYGILYKTEPFGILDNYKKGTDNYGNPNNSGETFTIVSYNDYIKYYNADGSLRWQITAPTLNASATGFIGALWHSTTTLLIALSDGSPENGYFVEIDISTGNITVGGINTVIASIGGATSSLDNRFYFGHKEDMSGFYLSCVNTIGKEISLDCTTATDLPNLGYNGIIIGGVVSIGSGTPYGGYSEHTVNTITASHLYTRLYSGDIGFDGLGTTPSHEMQSAMTDYTGHIVLDRRVKTTLSEFKTTVISYFTKQGLI